MTMDAKANRERQPDREELVGLADGAERALTVLMCDLVGSTPLSVSMPASHLGGMLLRYYALCSHRVERSEGQVIQYVGDAVLALFEHAEPSVGACHAVTAALEVRDRVREIMFTRRGDSRTELAVRISVVSGRGIRAALADTGQEAVFGPLPFVADRLKGAAKLNEVVLNSTAAVMVRDSFA